MFCGNCGAELGEGARFCPGCGAPVPVEDRETDTPSPEAPHPRRRLAAPVVAALVMLALATASSAAYLVYALVIDPLPPRSEQGADASAEEEEDAVAEEDATTEEAPATEPKPEAEPEPAPETEPAPEPAPEPAVTHDFECDAFYVDVPDSWVRSDATPVDGGPTYWRAADNGDGSYTFTQSSVAFTIPTEGWTEYSTGVAEVYVGVAAPNYCSYFGTTSDGRDVYVGEVSAPFLTNSYAGPDTLAVLTLK